MDEHSCAWALHLAAKSGDEGTVWDILCEAPEAATSTDTIDATPLHVAAAAGKAAVVSLMLAVAPGAAMLVDCSGLTPLHYAVWNAENAVAQVLAKAEPAALQVEEWDEDLTPLELASKLGRESTAWVLLEATPQAVATEPDFRARLLQHAAEGGMASLVQHVLEGQPVSDPIAVVRATCGSAGAGHEQVLRLLLQHAPAAALAEDEDALTPLHHAAIGGHHGAAMMLLEAAPASATVPDWHLALPVHYAARRAQGAAVIDLLLAAAPDSALQVDSCGCTPLQWAVKTGAETAVERLLAAAPGACMVADNEGRLPLHHAAQGGEVSIVRLLLSSRLGAGGLPAAAAATLDRRGLTPLHIAARHVNDGAIRLLLEADRGIAMARNHAGWLPLDMLLARVAKPLCRVDHGLPTLSYSKLQRKSLQEVLEAARPLLAVGPASELLCALAEVGNPDIFLYPEVVRRYPLSPEDWQLIPRPCPGLAAILPLVLARGSATEAGCLVARMSHTGRRMLRAAALALARVQRVLGVALPQDIVWGLLAAFSS